MILIDKLAYSARVRYKNPCFKALFSVVTLLFNIMTKSIALSILLLFVMGGLVLRDSKATLSYYLKLLCIPLVFLILSVIAIIVTITLEPLPAPAIRFLGISFLITKSSFLEGVQLILTALSSVSCLYYLALTTPMTDIVYVLKRMHCPSLLAEIFLLIYRFSFLLLDMAGDLNRSKTARMGNRYFWSNMKATASIFANIFIMAFRKTSRQSDSMDSRCYSGKIITMNRYLKTEKKEVAVFILFELCLLAFYIFYQWIYQ